MKPSHKQIYNFGQIARPPELLLSRKSRPDVEKMLGPDRCAVLAHYLDTV